jgi:hypothetical protein
MQEPSVQVQMFVIAYHVKRMQGGQKVGIPELQNAPCTQDGTRPQGDILGWSL